MPESFARTDDGQLLIANGIDNVLLWDAYSDQAVPAGVVAPTQQPTLAFTGSNVITGNYFCFVRFVDKYGNPSNLSPISAVAVAAGSGYANYANVEVPTQGTVARRQILRNTAGQTQTFYVDIDTPDLSSTSFTSLRDDTTLSAQQAVPVVGPGGEDLANLYAPPPDVKGAIVFHQGRMFMAAERPYSEGCAVTVFGAGSVYGVGTRWPATFVGRFISIDGADKDYQITAVDVVNQFVTLDSGYQGPTDPYAAYTIAPAPGYRRQIFFSQPLQPVAWPAVNAIAVPDDGDEITGLMSKSSFLYVLERRHVYRFTFQDDPATDGVVYLSATRGCVNQRCWVTVEDDTYMLDEQGVHAFSGGQASEPVSTPIQGMFRKDGAGAYRINWDASRFFHAAYYPYHEVVRFFVTLSGKYLPHHAICYHYRAKRWWVEEYAAPVGASCLGRVGRPTATWGTPPEQVYLGSDGGRTLASAVGGYGLDGPDPEAGTVRGTATSATLLSLTDAAASFAADGLVGAPLAIAAGRGRGQVRRVVAVSGDTLSVNDPWLVLPDATSVYQAGGFKYEFESGWWRYAPSESSAVRRVEVAFQPSAAPATLEVRTSHDFRPGFDRRATDYDPADRDGVGAAAGDDFEAIDLTEPGGVAPVRMDRAKELYLGGRRFVRLTLAGVANGLRFAVRQLVLNGVQDPGSRNAESGDNTQQ